MLPLVNGAWLLQSCIPSPGLWPVWGTAGAATSWQLGSFAGAVAGSAGFVGFCL